VFSIDISYKLSTLSVGERIVMLQKSEDRRCRFWIPVLFIFIMGISPAVSQSGVIPSLDTNFEIQNTDNLNLLIASASFAGDTQSMSSTHSESLTILNNLGMLVTMDILTKSMGNLQFDIVGLGDHGMPGELFQNRLAFTGANAEVRMGINSMQGYSGMTGNIEDLNSITSGDPLSTTSLIPN